MFTSKAVRLGTIEMPKYHGDAIYMHRVDLSKKIIMPEGLTDWVPFIENMLAMYPVKKGTAYITIDESFIKKGDTHRRGGAHIDGNYLFGWGGGGGWLTGTNGRELPEHQHKLQYLSKTGGMLMVSSYTACQGWLGDFEGIPAQGGNCEHLRSQLDKAERWLLRPGVVYMGNSTFIHESMPLDRDIHRTLVRITMPNDLELGI